MEENTNTLNNKTENIESADISTNTTNFNQLYDTEMPTSVNTHPSTSTHCTKCGRPILRDETIYPRERHPGAPTICRECYEIMCIGYINSYYFKPTPTFYEDLSDRRFFGVELEVDAGGYSNIVAKEIHNIANTFCDRKIYIKGDSSVPDGFEIVSHPMTLRYHMNIMKWEEIMEHLINSGYVSHSSHTCGLHCHVNRTSLGSTLEEQESTIANILYFVENNWDKMLSFSRRTEKQMSKWAARYGILTNPMDTLDYVNASNPCRYKCINLLNDDTVEFRMFNGTLRYNTFIATLQMVNEICNVAVSLSDKEMMNLSWSDFISRIGRNKNKELFTYLKEKGLLPNVQSNNIYDNQGGVCQCVAYSA